MEKITDCIESSVEFHTLSKYYHSQQQRYFWKKESTEWGLDVKSEGDILMVIL